MPGRTRRGREPALEHRSGTLADPGMLHSIQLAAGRLAPPGSARFQGYLAMAACPMPPLFREPWVLDTAWEVLSGNEKAALDLKDRMLGLLIRELQDDDRAQAVERFLGAFARLAVRHGVRVAPLRRDDMLAMAPRLASDVRRVRRLASQPRGRPVWPGIHNKGADARRRGPVPLIEDGMGEGLAADRVMPLGLALMQIADPPEELALLVSAQELGLAGAGQMHAMHAAANRSLESGDPEPFRSMLMLAGDECGPDDGPWRDPFTGIERPEIPGVDFMPPIRDPELAECLVRGAPMIPVGRPTRANRPVLEAIHPAHACPGHQVTLNGSNFGSETSVWFSAGEGRSTSAQVLSREEDRLIVRVPSDAVAGSVRAANPGPGYRRCGQFVPGVVYSNELDFSGGATVVHDLRVEKNGQVIGWAEPGEVVQVSWSVSPADAEVQLEVSEPDGSVIFVQDELPVEGSVDVELPALRTRRKLQVRLMATGSCETTSETLELPIDAKAQLTIEAMEITQGIQRFAIAQDGPNDVELVAGKGTVVRVFVSADRDGLDDDIVPIHGRLLIENVSLAPTNEVQTEPDEDEYVDLAEGDHVINARPAAELDREESNHSLNFYIPASRAQGTQVLRVNVWHENEITGESSAMRVRSWTWQPERKLSVRWTRVRLDAHDLARPDVTDTQYSLDRGVELLPASNEDVAPAPVSTYSSNRGLTNGASRAFFVSGLRSTRRTLITLYDMSSDAIYTAVVPQLSGASLGQANGSSVAWAQVHLPEDGPNSDRRVTTGHEFAHNLGFGHVDLYHNNEPSGTEFHPNDGYLEEVAFDPGYHTTITKAMDGRAEGVGDFMSYYRPRRTSIYQWNRLRDEI